MPIKMNGLNAMESPRLYIFRIKETTLFMHAKSVLGRLALFTACLEVNLPSLQDCQSQMIAIMIATG